MTVWRDVIGQDSAVATLHRAATDPASMTHAWLLTGPPGSGRSVAARAFAAALQCPREVRGVPGVPHRRGRLARRRRRHRDRGPVDQGRPGPRPRAARRPAAIGGALADHHHRGRRPADRLLRRPRQRPAQGAGGAHPAHRVDPVRPSVEDVIITIRSRSRHVRLRTPPAEAVAELLQRRDGVDGPMAMYAARAAQSHVGLARRLARDEGARIRRRDVIALAGKIRGVGHAIDAAADLAKIADEESGAASTERDAAERQRLMEVLGADPRPAPSRRTSVPRSRPWRRSRRPAPRAGPGRARPLPARPAVDLPRRARPAPARPSAWSTRTPAASSTSRTR